MSEPSPEAAQAYDDLLREQERLRVEATDATNHEDETFALAIRFLETLGRLTGSEAESPADRVEVYPSEGRLLVLSWSDHPADGPVLTELSENAAPKSFWVWPEDRRALLRLGELLVERAEAMEVEEARANWLRRRQTI